MSGGLMSGGRISGGRMSGGRMSGGRMSGGRLSVGLKSYDHYFYSRRTKIYLLQLCLYQAFANVCTLWPQLISS